MELAPTLPPVLYTEVDDGDYHFLQAHLVEELQSSRLYEWCRDRGYDDSGRSHVVILDNGTWELGEPQADALERVARSIHPDVIVCPDVLKKGARTVELLEQYGQMCQDLAPVVMLVPHGGSVPEWCHYLQCMLYIAGEVGIEACMVGIPKVLETFPGGRFAACCYLEGVLKEYDKSPVITGAHLLGVWSNFWEAVHLSKYFPWIVGLDTTWPYALAVHDHICGPGRTKYHLEQRDWFPEYTGGIVWPTSLNIRICRKLLEPTAPSVHSFDDPWFKDTDPRRGWPSTWSSERLRDATRPGRGDRS